MIYPPEENKKIGKSRIQTYETLKYFAKKNGQKNCIHEILSVFQKLNAKKWLNFYWNEIKVPHVAQKDIF